ncbi:MAG: hypothetical protein VX436_03965 [Planctomycetota bacterium]|nr:hypothetical protein [Planctomycetota bacterium]
MPQMILHIILFVLALNIMGCGDKTNTTSNAFMGADSDPAGWDFGDISSNATLNQPNKGEEGSGRQYAIAVATFTGDGHEKEAQKKYSELMAHYPSIGRGLVVRKRSRGSALTYGHYLGYDDLDAKRDLLMLRGVVTQQGTPLFGQLLLTKFRSAEDRQSLHPYDLWTIRKEYPTIVPIYTLEVAVWGDFDSGQLPLVKRHAAAERYASELRGKGYEAFFYHNDDSQLSSVTVGLFSYKAIDAETGFYSAEVEAMLARFPQRLMNGEPVLEYHDPSNHSRGTKVQSPCLAEVPID